MLTVGLLIAWGDYVPSKVTSVFHDSAAPKTSGLLKIHPSRIFEKGQLKGA